MMAIKYTSLRIREDRKIELEKAAIEISHSIGKQIRWTELANILFDEYLKEAKEDLKARRPKND